MQCDAQVWAPSLSLAATHEMHISFYSSWYWDVSLPRVRSFIIKIKIVEVYSTGFPHSEIFGSKVAKHLPEAYRSNATSFIAS